MFCKGKGIKFLDMIVTCLDKDSLENNFESLVNMLGMPDSINNSERKKHLKQEIKDTHRKLKEF